MDGCAGAKHIVDNLSFQVPVGIDDVLARDRAALCAAVSDAIATGSNLHLNGMTIDADAEAAAGIGGGRAVGSGFLAGHLLHGGPQRHFRLVGGLQVADQSKMGRAQGDGRHADDGQQGQHEQGHRQCHAGLWVQSVHCSRLWLTFISLTTEVKTRR